MDTNTCPRCINKEEFEKSVKYIVEKLDMMEQCKDRYPSFWNKHAEDIVAELEKYVKY